MTTLKEMENRNYWEGINLSLPIINFGIVSTVVYTVDCCELINHNISAGENCAYDLYSINYGAEEFFLKVEFLGNGEINHSLFGVID
jgi:hypothetical protein